MAKIDNGNKYRQKIDRMANKLEETTTMGSLLRQSLSDRSLSTSSGDFSEKINYDSGYEKAVQLKLALLAIKENKERNYNKVLTDAIVGRTRVVKGAFAESSYIFGLDSYIDPVDLPKVKELLKPIGFETDFVSNSTEDKYVRPVYDGDIYYHEILVKVDEKNFPIAAIMIMEVDNNDEIKHDLEIDYVGDVDIGHLVKEKIVQYLHKREFLPMFSTAKEIINNYEGTSILFRDEILDEKAEIAKESFFPWMKDSIENFSKKYIESNSPIIVLRGPPGTGKTTFVRTMAKFLTARVITTADLTIASSSTLLECYKDLLEKAKLIGDKRPYILLLEDVDQLLKTRLSGNRQMAKLLNETKGIAFNKDIRVIFTTNLMASGDIDPALTRPGRCFANLFFRKLTKDEAMKVRKDLGYEEIDLTSLLKKDNHVSLAECIDESEFYEPPSTSVSALNMNQNLT